MKTKLLIALCSTLALLYSCSDDEPAPIVKDDAIDQVDPDPDPEPEPDPDPAEILAQDREESITTLTADTEKVWRIAAAVLNNSNGSFDISNEFNITDDEFIFKNSKLTSKNTDFEGTLEWRGGFDFNIFAASVEESITELYLPTKIAAFDFNTESGSELASLLDDSDMVISIEGETLSAVWNFDVTTNLTLDLTPKLVADYKQIPTAALQFTEAFTFESNGIDNFAPGMTASLSDNSFYVATRESAFNDGSVNPERVIRFNLDTGASNERLYFNSDFVSKQVNVIDDKLYVIGGQRINRYDLSLANEPTSTQNYGPALGLEYLGLSRYGTAVLDNLIYIVGGDLDNNLTDKILVFDTQSETLSEFATMPEARSGARAEIVNNKLYIFGGTTAFFTPPAKDTIYIFDLLTGDLTVESLPTPIDFSFTGKNENLIYVGGVVRTYDDEQVQTDRDPYMGVYDTRTGTFTSLETNLVSANNETIHSMAVFNNKIYVLYGQNEEQSEGVLQTWSILEAGL